MRRRKTPPLIRKREQRRLGRHPAPPLRIAITCQKACCQLHHDCSIMKQHRESLRTVCIVSVCVCVCGPSLCVPFRSEQLRRCCWDIIFYVPFLQAHAGAPLGPWFGNYVSGTWGTQTTITSRKTSNKQDRIQELSIRNRFK